MNEHEIRKLLGRNVTEYPTEDTKVRFYKVTPYFVTIKITSEDHGVRTIDLTQREDETKEQFVIRIKENLDR